jgi:hypothetical protein
MRIPRPTYGGVVATIALFVALGGSSYAAITISGSNVRNGTLTGADVKSNSLSGSDVKNSSITASDVKNGSLLAADFQAGQLPAGPQGPAGPAGPAGPQGPAGATNVVSRRSDILVPGGNATRELVAKCQPGEVAVGGGANITGAINAVGGVISSEPLKADETHPANGEPAGAWRAIALNNGVLPREMSVFVLCAQP